MNIKHISSLILLIMVGVWLGQAAIMEPTSSDSVEEQRQFLLYHLNAEREKKGTFSLYIDESLNDLAQSHNDYMISEEHYSHYTREGLDPKDRAQAANFTYPVRELIGKGATLTEVHEYLVSYEINYVNIINKQHTRVGIGIGVAPNDVIVVTMVFSTRDFLLFPYTEDEYASVRQFVAEYITQRDQFAKEESPQLSELVQGWIDEGKIVDGFDYIQDSGYLGKGKVTMSATYVTFLPPGPSLADAIQFYDLSFFVKNRKGLKKLGVGISPQIDGGVEVWVFYISSNET